MYKRPKIHISASPTKKTKKYVINNKSNDFLRTEVSLKDNLEGLLVYPNSIDENSPHYKYIEQSKIVNKKIDPVALRLRGLKTIEDNDKCPEPPTMPYGPTIDIHYPPPLFGPAPKDCDPEPVYYCVTSKNQQNPQNRLFDRDSFRKIKQPWRNLLDAAASRWEKLIKATNVPNNWKGIKIQNLSFTTNNRFFASVTGLPNVIITINKDYCAMHTTTWIDILTHELGHVLGAVKPSLDGRVIAVGNDKYPQTVQAYNNITNSNVDRVPLERFGGPGTPGAHWTMNTNTILGVQYPFIPNEIMTATLTIDEIISGSNRQISLVTIKYLTEPSRTIDRVHRFLFSEINSGSNEEDLPVDNPNDECVKEVISSDEFDSTKHTILSMHKTIQEANNICECPDDDDDDDDDDDGSGYYDQSQNSYSFNTETQQWIII